MLNSEHLCSPNMLCAKRKLDGQTVAAYSESISSGPFQCLDCNDPVILKTGTRRISHFAHENPVTCKFGEGESDTHRRCKLEIFRALKNQPEVQAVAMEYALGEVRPDVIARIRGRQIAIEVQISCLSIHTIIQRTIEYARKGICVLWLLPWRPGLDQKRYAPQIWEKWLHATYFGRVYYWLNGLNVVSYHFDPCLTPVPKQCWYSTKGQKMTADGYTKRSKRYRTAVRGKEFNLVTDFAPTRRFWWEGNGVKIPDALLFMEKRQTKGDLL